MIDANTIERELLRSLERLVYQADFNEFVSAIINLKELGYKVHIKVNPEKELYNFQLKQCLAEHKSLITQKEILRKLVLAEKFAAIRSQEFEYAARLRDLENKIENISGEEAYRTLEALINLNFEYSIAVYNQVIFIVIQTELHFLKYIENEIYKTTSQKYSLKFESIEEKVIEYIKLNASTRELLQKNFESVIENCFVYVASVSQNRAKEIIYLQPFSNYDRKPAISLKEHLKSIDCTEIRSLTLLCTYYIELDKPLLPYMGIQHPLVDEILSDSLGWLAYPHQLITLFSLATGIKSKGKISKFVDDFNNKDKREVDAYLSQSLFDSTLGEILNERIILKQGNLKYPNYFYGFKLFNFCYKNF